VNHAAQVGPRLRLQVVTGASAGERPAARKPDHNLHHRDLYPSRTIDRTDSHASTAARRRWLILGVIAIAQLMVVVDVTIINVALPSIQRELVFSIADRQWVVTAYALAFVSLLLVGGSSRTSSAGARRPSSA
jgi:hypothetical protein